MKLQEFKNTTLLDSSVSFAIENGLWLNATQVAKQHGKRMDNYWRDDIKYIKTVAKLSSLNMSDLKSTVVGKGKEQGTYIHPDLVIGFARWISDEFAYACDKYIKDQLIASYELAAEKDRKEIQRLKSQKKLVNIYNDKWTSARGLVQHTNTKYKEHEIKDFMYSMNLIKPEHKVTRYWRATKKGINSGLVSFDDMETPLYEMEKVIQYMDDFHNLLNDMKPIEGEED